MTSGSYSFPCNYPTRLTFRDVLMDREYVSLPPILPIAMLELGADQLWVDWRSYDFTDKQAALPPIPPIVQADHFRDPLYG